MGKIESPVQPEKINTIRIKINTANIILLFYLTYLSF